MSKAIRGLQAEMEAGQIAQVYILIGEEDWSRKKFLTLVKRILVDPSMEDFNFELLHAETTKGSVAADRAAQWPVMADWRLVIVENCDAWKKHDLDEITKYVVEPNEKGCLVLSFAEPDKRRKLFQIKNRQVRYVEFPRPKAWELNEYVKDLASDMKLSMTQEGLELVVELAGDDIAKVHRELDKLSIYKHGGGKITAEDVEGLLGRTRQVTRWELNEYIGNRDLAGALVKAHDILNSGEEPLGLLSAIQLYLRQLFLAKELLVKRKVDKAKMSQLLGVQPRIAESLAMKQRAYSDWELRQGILLAREADYQLKSIGIDKKLVIDQMLCQFMIPTR